MKSRAGFLAILIVAPVILSISILFGREFISTLEPTNIPTTADRKIVESKFYEPTLFLQGIEQNNAQPLKFTEPVLGVIVPHHLLASQILSDIFSILREQEPKTLIILGPNHREVGSAGILSSRSAWATPYGVVQPNDEVLNELQTQLEIEFNDDLMQQEHSITGLLPYVSYYSPNTTVVPLLVSGTLSMSEIDALVAAIGAQVDPELAETILVTSIDFSHGLTAEEADKRDEITKQMINDRNFSGILKLNNEYLDASPVLVTLLKVMDSLDLKQSDYLHHTNSGKLLNRLTAETTSYLTLIYFR